MLRGSAIGRRGPYSERMKRARIDGLYELGHVLYALEGGSQGVERGDVVSVERFWTFGDMHSSTAGFVLCLKDGRRSYVDFRHWHGFEQDEDFTVTVSFLESGQVQPDLAPGEPVADGPRRPATSSE